MKYREKPRGFRLCHLIVCLLTSSLCAAPDPLAGMADLRVNPGFRELLGTVPAQLDTGGANFVRKNDGTLWLISIGLAEARDGGATELLRRQQVARGKALAAAVALVNGEKVTAISQMSDKTHVKMVNGKETAVVEETLSESIVTQAKGLVRGMGPVASWTDKDRKLAFVAIAQQIK